MFARLKNRQLEYQKKGTKMPIAGIVILTAPEKTENVLIQLKKIDKVTTYGIHKDNYIIAVFEGDTIADLENINDHILAETDGVMGIYPAYVNYEEDGLDEELT